MWSRNVRYIINIIAHCCSVTSNSNLSELARKLQELQTSVGGSTFVSLSSCHTMPPLSVPLSIPSHPSTPVTLAAQPTFSHDLSMQLAGVSPSCSFCFRIASDPSFLLINFHLFSDLLKIYSPF